MALAEQGRTSPAGSGATDAGPRYQLGREASRRFDFAWWGRRRPGTKGPLPAPGTLGPQCSRFAELVGRSFAVRRSLGQRLAFPPPLVPWPARTPEEYLPLAGLRQRFRISPSAAERNARLQWEIERRMRGAALARPARRLPAELLPRASARASQSRLGRGTGPAGAPQRAASELVFVANPPEVRAAAGIGQSQGGRGSGAR